MSKTCSRSPPRTTPARGWGAATTPPWPTSARKRAELLAATETQLQPIDEPTRRKRRPLRGTDKIGLRVGKVRNKFKMAKHFDLHITDAAFSFTRNQDSIAAEAALDGIYLLRTSLPDNALGRDDVVGRYKDLPDVE